MLELTLREALRLGHNYVGTEHMLLAALTMEDDPAVTALAGLGVTKGPAEQEIGRMLDAITRAEEAPHDPRRGTPAGPAGPLANLVSRLSVARRVKAAAGRVTPWPHASPFMPHTQRIVPEANTLAPLGAT